VLTLHIFVADAPQSRANCPFIAAGLFAVNDLLD
jgi:hypothetical protein